MEYEHYGRLEIFAMVEFLTITVVVGSLIKPKRNDNRDYLVMKMMLILPL